jgi:hypothetical protein
MSWNYEDISLTEFLDLLVLTEVHFILQDTVNNLYMTRLRPTTENAHDIGYKNDNLQPYTMILKKYQGHYLIYRATTETVKDLLRINRFGFLDDKHESPGPNSFATIRQIGNLKRIEILYGDKGLSIKKSDQFESQLGISDNPTRTFQFVFLGGTDSINNFDFERITLMHNWFKIIDRDTIEDLIKNRGSTYQNEVIKLCRTRPKFSDCQSFCPVNSKNPICIESFTTQCFKSNSPNSIYNTDKCREFCSSNLAVCNNIFSQPNSKYCNSIDDLLGSSNGTKNYCSDFYNKTFWNCNAYPDQENKNVCLTGYKKYEELCNSESFKLDPRCSCISKTQIDSTLKSYFDRIKKTAKNNLIIRINLILTTGKIRPPNSNERDMTESEKLVLENNKNKLLLELDYYYKTQLERQIKNNNNCYSDDCLERKKRTLQSCLRAPLIIADCFNSINIWELLNGRIYGGSNNQECTISIYGACTGVCDNPNLKCERGYCVKKDESGGCLLDSQCGLNEKCINGVCTRGEEPKCTPTSCPKDQECIDGVCRDIKKCNRQNPCKNNQGCVSGVCKDCGFFEYSNENICKFNNNWLFGGIGLIVLIFILILIIFLIYYFGKK